MNLFESRSEAQWNELLNRIYTETGMVASLATAEGKILLSQGEAQPALRPHSGRRKTFDLRL